MDPPKNLQRGGARQFRRRDPHARTRRQGRGQPDIPGRAARTPAGRLTRSHRPRRVTGRRKRAARRNLPAIALPSLARPGYPPIRDRAWTKGGLRHGRGTVERRMGRDPGFKTTAQSGGHRPPDQPAGTASRAAGAWGRFHRTRSPFAADARALLTKGGCWPCTCWTR